MADAFTDALVSAMQHSTEPMVLSDPHLPDAPLIAINPAFEALTGYAKSEIVGRNCRFLQGPGTDQESVERIRSSLRAGQGCIEWIVNHRKDGTAFWNLLFISPVTDGAGRVRYFFGNQLDITHGPPPSLDEFQLGRAHMPPESAAAFHTLVAQIAADAAAPADAARALERVTAAARRLSALTIGLTPGEA